MNNYMLMVLEELRNDTFFYKSNSILRYTIPKDGEVLDNKMFGGKVTAIWDLHSLGAIEIHNKGEERIPGTTIYEFEILIIQPAFDGIYKKCIKEVAGQSLENYENQIQIKKNIPALLRKLNDFIKVNSFGKKQTKLLLLLSTFEPKPLDDLETQIQTKDIKDLKKRVKIKIKGSGFYIKTLRSKSSFKRGAYQLITIPPSLD